MLICKVTSYKHLLKHDHGFMKYKMQEFHEIQFHPTMHNKENVWNLFFTKESYINEDNKA